MFNYTSTDAIRHAYATKAITKRDAEAYAKAYASHLLEQAMSAPAADRLAALDTAKTWLDLDLSDIRPAERKPEPTVDDYAEVTIERAQIMISVANAMLAGEIAPNNLPTDFTGGWRQAVTTANDAWRGLPDDLTARQAYAVKQLTGFAERKLQGGALGTRATDRNAAKVATKGKNDLYAHIEELRQTDGGDVGYTVKPDGSLHRETAEYTAEEVNHSDFNQRLPRWSAVAAGGHKGRFSGWVLTGTAGERGGKPALQGQQLTYLGDDESHEALWFDSEADREEWLSGLI